VKDPLSKGPPQVVSEPGFEHADKQAEIYNIDLDHSSKVLSMQEDDTEEEINKEHEEAYKNINWNASLDHVQSKEPQYIKRYHGIKKKSQTESEVRKNMKSYLKNTEGYKMDFFKGKTYNEILLIFQAKFDANMREEMEAEDEEIIKSINETPAQKAAKRRKRSEEAQEADNLRKRLEIVVAASIHIPAAKPKTLTITAALAVSTTRRKRVVIRDPEEDLPSNTPAETPKVKDKGKGILIEASKPMKKKDQIEMDAKYARKLQEEINTPTVKDKGKGILIKDPKPMKKKEQVEMDAEYAKKLKEELDKEHKEAYKNIDWNAAFDHVQSKKTQYIKRYHGFKKKPQSKFEARKNMISYLKNTKGFKMEFFKGKTYDQILLIFQAMFDANMKFLFKTREEIEKEDEEIIKSINETPAQKAAKRRKLSEEAQEADDLRRRLEIVHDEDDDVFVKAIPLA
nr:hypothetical protein [Tanacetum cinerariifolium]